MSDKLKLYKGSTSAINAHAIENGSIYASTDGGGISLDSGGSRIVLTAQSDWNENDETSNAYVKNRPFYSLENILIDEQTITLTGSAIGSATIDANIYEDIVSGANYEVMYRGNVVYNVVGQDGYLSFEDTRWGGIVNITGNGSQYTIRDTGGGGSTIIKLSSSGELKKIDEKYLPDGASIGKTGTANNAEIFNDYEGNEASNTYAHAEGHSTTASGHSSHAEGYDTTASGNSSHAEGSGTTASESYSHAEGSNTTASGPSSHAEGTQTTASADSSHAEGTQTEASGLSSHAEGSFAVASGNFSHAEGYGTIASSSYQHVQGRYNVEDANNTYVHIVGYGDSNSSRKNIHTLDKNGCAWYQGNIKIGGTSYDNASEVALKSDLDWTDV